MNQPSRLPQNQSQPASLDPRREQLDLEQLAEIAELRRAIRHARVALDGGFYKKAIYIVDCRMRTLGTTNVEMEAGNILASIATAHSDAFYTKEYRKAVRKKMDDAIMLIGSFLQAYNGR